MSKNKLINLQLQINKKLKIDTLDYTYKQETIKEMKFNRREII